MLKWFKAFLIFAAMAAVPIIADNLLSTRPDLPLGIGPEGSLLAILLLGAIALASGIAWYYQVRERLEFIESCLRLAQRDMNALLASGMEHGGRKAKAVERSEWNRMTVSPGTQVFNAGYRTPAHDLIDLNERDLAGKGSAMGKAAATAFLFRELYEGSVGSAQAKIFADVRNGGNVPYIAPGIRELIGFDLFDREEGFPEGAGVADDELKWVAKHRKFPSDDLVMVSTSAAGVRTAMRGRDVLLSLTQQRAPKD